MRRVLAALAVLFASRAAWAEEPATQAPKKDEPRPWSLRWQMPEYPEGIVRIAANGYLLPQFEVVSLPSALPRDRTAYGARGSRAGFVLHGTPLEDFGYVAHVVISPGGTENLALLDPTQPGGAAATTAPGAVVTGAGGTNVSASGVTLSVEELTLGYRPVQWFRVKAGFLRIPFSVAGSMPIPKQMFPIRPLQVIAFQSGADGGVLSTFAPLDGRVLVHLGVYDGLSLGTFGANQTVRGAVFGASVEAHPLGTMPLREGDEGRGPPRFALGFGTLYRPVTAYDATGYEASTYSDTRIAASLRASWQGLYVQGELLRRVQTDDLSKRPIVATGGYGQASYFLSLASIGANVAFAPMVRAGAIAVDQDFTPRTFTSFEAGLGFFPVADAAEPERLRIILEYIGVNVTPQNESQREGLAQLQVEW